VTGNNYFLFAFSPTQLFACSITKFFSSVSNYRIFVWKLEEILCNYKIREFF